MRLVAPLLCLAACQWSATKTYPFTYTLSVVGEGDGSLIAVTEQYAHASTFWIAKYQDGAEVWRSSLWKGESSTEYLADDGEWLAVDTEGNSYVITPPKRGGVQSLDRDGRPRWHVGLAEGAASVFSLGDEVIVAAANGGVLSLSASDGTERWRRTGLGAIDAYDGIVAVSGGINYSSIEPTMLKVESVIEIEEIGPGGSTASATRFTLNGLLRSVYPLAVASGVRQVASVSTPYPSQPGLRDRSTVHLLEAGKEPLQVMEEPDTEVKNVYSAGNTTLVVYGAFTPVVNGGSTQIAVRARAFDRSGVRVGEVTLWDPETKSAGVLFRDGQQWSICDIVRERPGFFVAPPDTPYVPCRSVSPLSFQ